MSPDFAVKMLSMLPKLVSSKLSISSLVLTKSSYIFKQTCSFQLQVFLSMYDLLVDTKR